VPDRLHAQVDQIRRARQLDDAEYRHRALDHRADAQRHGGDLGINPDLPAHGRTDTRRPPEAHGTADDEQHVRARNSNEDNGDQRERQQMPGGKHNPTLVGQGGKTVGAGTATALLG